MNHAPGCRDRARVMDTDTDTGGVTYACPCGFVARVGGVSENALRRREHPVSVPSRVRTWDEQLERQE